MAGFRENETQILLYPVKTTRILDRALNIHWQSFPSVYSLHKPSVLIIPYAKAKVKVKSFLVIFLFLFRM